MSEYDEHRYMLLGRLKMDCEYYLGWGRRNPKRLWAREEAAHIAKMREVHASLPVPPEWITLEDIEAFAIQMGVIK